MRLLGCDCPELRPFKLINDRELHIECGHIVQKFVKSEIENKIVKIQTCNKNDCYGRILGDVILENGNSLSNMLINLKYAFSYDGKTKKIFLMM